MDVNRESAAVNIVSGVIELLEKLGVEHADDEIEGAVIVGDDGEDGGLALAHLGQLQLVVLGDGGQGLQVELGQPGDQGDLDGFQGFAAAGMVVLVILQSDVLGVAVLQTAEQNIQRRNVLLVVFLYTPVADHLHDHGEILLLRRGLVVEIGNQGQQQRFSGIIPEGVLGLGPLGGGVFENVCHQPQNVVVVVQIHEGVVAVTLFHVDKVNHLDDVPLPLQKAACVS